jgi:hypothetical protein
MGGKVAKLVIDQRSCKSVVSEEAVRKLELQTKRHPTPYWLEWLTKGNKLMVSKHCLVSFSIGAKYRDNVWCDVVNIETCHLLLGKPWKYDKATTHDKENNTYNFMVDKVKFTLLSSQETGPKPLKGDGQSFVAKQKLMDKESGIKGVVSRPIKEQLEGFVDVF